jgi:hypothetical protein
MNAGRAETSTHPRRDGLRRRIRVPRLALVAGLAVLAALALTPGTSQADPADGVATNAVFRVNQSVSPGTNVTSGTAVSITYTWPGGGAKVVTRWGNAGTETHQTVANSLTVTRVLSTCLQEEKVNVFTTVTKGNGDHGSAAIAIFVHKPNPPWCA